MEHVQVAQGPSGGLISISNFNVFLLKKKKAFRGGEKLEENIQNDGVRVEL